MDIEPISGLKVELAGMVTKGFQLSGTWKYNKIGNSFGLSTAVISNPEIPDSSFLAGNLRSDGKLDCRGQVNLGSNYSLSMEAGFQNAEEGGYILELNKAFSNSTASFKAGSNMRSFSYMHALWNNCHVGFECNYIVPLLNHLGKRRPLYVELWREI